ncbi:MAG TPA: hypothetical protein VKK81_04440 [Candidatus Binatia bacterium]|nr:hypothetical protein [Candidatus Binatia bacterium]
MAPYVIDLDECGGAVQRSHGSDCKIMGRLVLSGNLISRCYQCA